MRPVAIRTARLVLDEPTLADADRVAEYCRDPLFERYLTTPWPYSRADAEAFLGVFVPESWASGTERTWAIRRAPGGELLGVIGVREPRHEIGYWMGAAHRGAGLMTEAAVAVADWALAGGVRGATTLFWRAVEGNVASARVARAAGFRRIEPADPTVPARDGDALPAWHAVRTVPADPRAFESWTDILGPG
ncbi:RimJ/RimL family protein N-acetyltransferase [Agromyces ramosus]|jgi:RimJ/RimL family protein N-acetyltransferase|uniref:RimJ/RimL family protein N-acetyltransferase n=1 Tax=Agromyces ramosus TaxID=33879 RepID=A0A4Q7MMH4_9MICO|nr:GNAT family N-acetyltransferase [Agromyces ramosus]RZS67972.1 RimJ/RimL family protein N-acetyltransferase [Agromyces ramosus]